MLSRRVLLAAMGVGAATLTACGLVPPGPSSPTTTPAAPATPDAAGAALADLHAALARAHSDEQDPARLALLAWAVDVSTEQAGVVRVALPPVPARTPTATPATTPAAPAPSLEALRSALRAVVPIWRTQALDAATAQPLVWAAMGAWARSVGASLDRPGAALEARRDRLPPPVQTVAEAGLAALSASEEALYGVQTAGGAPGLSPDDLARVRGRIVFWQQLRDDLRGALGPTPSPSPTPGPPWFLVPQPPDAAAAAALVVRLESSALPILGRSLAFGSDAVRARLTDAVGELAVDLPAWGGPLLRWPGWPA